MINKPLCSLVVSVFMFFAVSTNSIAYDKDNIKFKVISNKIVTEVSGVNSKIMTWKNAKKTKGLIVELEVKVPRDMTLWSTDFSVFYLHKNKKDLEDRGRSRAMTLAVSSPDDEGAWVVGNYVKTSVKAGTRYIKLLFPAGNDVDKVSLNYSYPVVRDIIINRN